MAQVQKYGRKAQLNFVLESTTGTYEVPAGDGSAMMLIEDGWTYTVNAENYLPKYSTADWLNMDGVPGKKHVVITFRLPLKGSGTAGTAPEFDAVLKSLGLDVTNAPATSDTYAPVSTFSGAGNPGGSYSCSLLVDGFRYAGKNGFCTATMAGDIGQPGFLEVTYTGGYVAPAADALEAVSGYDTTIPPAFMGGTFAIGGATPTGINAFSLDFGGNVVLIEDVNDAHGIAGARLTDRTVTGTVSVEMLIARDDFALWAAGTTGAITTGVIGGTAGNRWALTITRAWRDTPSMAQEDGIVKHTIPFMASSVVTDVEGTTDPLTLAFT